MRLASAAVLAPLALLALWRGGWAWELLVVAGVLGLAAEWTRLCGLARGNLALPAALLVSLLLAWAYGWGAGLAAVALFTLLTAWRFGRVAGSGVPYIGVAAFALLWLRLRPDGALATLFLVLVIWSTDIGAYLVGRLAGGPKLAPHISPGKTVSGALGGLVCAALAGALVARLGLGHAALRAAALSAVLSLSGQAGDLLESSIKRRLGVKDSGHTIPGHGGLFDRLDGFLIAAPVAVAIALAVEHGIIPISFQ